MSDWLPYPPADFDAFWAETESEASAAPLDFSRKPGPEIDLVTFRGIDGSPLHGWFCAPESAPSPAFLWINPYGRESLLPNRYGTRSGFASFSFNFFGHDALHQEKYVRERGYFSEGIESPRTSVFRSMYQNASIAMRVLAEQPEVDRARLAAMGMSQGGGIAIWLGAHCPAVRTVCADMPFLGAMRVTLAHKVHRYPLKELIDYAETHHTGMDRILETLAYFDTVNQASRCHVPTHVSLGLKDPAARPDHVRAIYAALPGPKTLVEYDWGHDWHEAMIEANRAWMLRSFAENDEGDRV